MTDIVERLRTWPSVMKGQRIIGLPGTLNDDLRVAADEIERLRATIDTAAEAIERGSTSAPIAEILRTSLSSHKQSERG